MVKNLPDNLDLLNASPNISRITIWDCEADLLYDSQIDYAAPSDILLESWHCPWSDAELLDAEEQIKALREKERQSRLGQMPAIDELERRLNAVTQSFDMTML